ncbi:hypothetical protein JCM5353_001527 [Sporobolomyces roseus]
MRTSSLLFAVASTATLAAAQSYDYGSIQRNPLTAQAPTFVQAYSNCIYDNCAPSDVPVAILVLQVLCADLGTAIQTTGITGAATTVSLPPVTLNSGATSAPSGSATAITSGAMSESTGLVTSTDSTGGVVVGPGGGIRTSINLDSASTLPIGASSTVSGALGSASSGISGAAGTASSALSGAASSATGAVGGAASSVVNGASSVVSAASGGLQSAMPSNPVSAAGNVAAPVAFTMAGLLLTIFA